MAAVNRILTALFDVVYVPLGALPRWLSLTLLSAIAGIIALVVVKYTSNQRAIERIKNDIKANMLAIKLYRDDMRVMFGAQRRLIWAALRMQYRMLPPLAVMLVPFVLMAAQMSLRYQWRPLRAGEAAVLEVALREDAERADFDLSIRGSAAFEVSHRVRGLAERMVSWRIVPQADGVHTIAIRNGRESFTKRLAVGDAVDRVCPVRPGGSLIRRVAYPAEEPFSSASLVQSISLFRYPDRASWYAGANWWLVWFLVVSIASALAFKPILKVKL